MLPGGDGVSPVSARPGEAEYWMTKFLSFSKGHLHVTVRGTDGYPIRLSLKITSHLAPSIGMCPGLPSGSGPALAAFY